MTNQNLHTAKVEKNDEFYTQYADIENELQHYKKHFKNKVVYCNCDSIDSNFVKYFQDNFKRLRIKKLLFSSLPVDFRSPEAIEILKECDIVITNPPFSLFREYVAQLTEYDKKFLIIGNQNAITYKEIFKLIKENKLWLGVSLDGRNIWYEIPDSYTKYHKIENGKKYAFVASTVWFTNLEHYKRNEKLRLINLYKGNEDEYPEYDNYDAIEVSKVVNIPIDYDGLMGVPITFLHKYNPQQFEIIWTTDRGGDGILEEYKKKHTRFDAPVVKGKGIYKRIIIKKK